MPARLSQCLYVNLGPLQSSTLSPGSNIDKSDATIIYGVVRLLATLIGALLLRRFARRPLLVVSALCVCLGMIVLGYTTHHNTSGGTEQVFVTNYLPLIAVNFIAVSYQFGLGPVGWSYTGIIAKIFRHQN